MESLSDAPAVPAAPADVQPREKSPRAKLYIGLGITAAAILLVALVIVAAVSVNRMVGVMRQPAKALTIYTDALIRQDYPTAYNIASPGLRQAISYPGLVEYHNKLTDRLGAFKSAKQKFWNIETKNGVTACTIQTTLQFDRGIEAFEFVLHKENGAWRVFSYKQLGAAGVGDN